MEDIANIRLNEAIVLLGKFPALTGVNLEAHQGEKIMITGPNGAGKTTLLRLLAGLVRMSKGSGNVLGVNLQSRNLSTLHSRVGLLGVRSMFYQDLTVLENLKFWSEAWSSKKEAKREIKNALSYLELNSDFWNLPVRLLSTGQRRRAALALQVLKRPTLWLLDEPHAGLDKTGRDLVDEIITRAAESGGTVIFSSHELERAGHLADRHLELAGGRFK